MKKTLILITFIAIIASLLVGCGGKKQGELKFELNESGTEYTVSFVGRKNCSDIIIPEEHEGLPVTKIADFAFRNNRRLKSITIPASITHIGKKAFIGCTGLESVHLNDLKAWCEITFDYTWISYQSNPLTYAEGLYVNDELVTELVIPEDVTRINNAAFYKCPGITSVTIPQGVIGECAFSECTTLKEINIGEGVSAIEICAFEQCTGLEKVYFNAVNMSDPIGMLDTSNFPIYNYIFSNAGEKSDGIHVIIGKSATRIPSRLFSATDDASVVSLEFEEGGVCKTISHYAFENCPDLKSINIPDFVESIESYAFAECTSLSDVTISDKLTKISPYAFLNCVSITEFTVPNGLTSINPTVFSGCTGLTSINVPASIGTFNADAIRGCYNITEINVDENNANFKTIDGNVYSKDGKTLIKVAPGKTEKEFTVPDGVVTVGNYAFCDCRNLVKITIPDSVTSIGDFAFNGCSDLESVIIGNGVTKIDNYAFADCIRLKSVNIPDGVTRIGSYAFKNCRKLKKITLPASITEIGDYAFFGCEGLTIRCRTTAKPAGWSAIWNPDKRRVVWGYTEK